MKTNRINNFLIAVSLIINTVYLILIALNLFDTNILVCLSLYLVIFIPKILRKKTNFKIYDVLELIYIAFIFLAQLLGSIMNFYDYIYWFDSFVHFVSGTVTSIFAIALLLEFNKYKYENKAFNIIYMITFTLAIAAIWELFEFSCDNILGDDAQKVLTTGVYDTMKDIICALLGSILISILYYFNKINGFIKIITTK